MRTFLFAVVAFAFGCGHTGVQKPAKESTVVVEKSSPDRLNQCADGVAREYNVPSEPETAMAIFEAMAKGDESLAKQEKRLISAGFTGTDNAKVFCMVWDLREPKSEFDYGTCRNGTVAPNQKIMVQKYPHMYFVDVNGKAKGNVDQMYIFLDPDADGDVCNVVLVRALK